MSADSLPPTKSQFQEFDKLLRTVHGDVVKLQIRYENTHANVESLLKIVRDGNGRPLVSRILVLEETQKDMERAICEQRRERTQMRLALIAGILGLLTAIVSSAVHWLSG